MQPLDGNAIGGLLIDVFGAEMTTVTGTCATCGTRGQLAELVVYTQSPGTVVRCRACTAILMVFTQIKGMTCADLSGLEALGA